jgi:hypothetical protein
VFENRCSAKVKEIVSNQLSLVIEPDYSQQNAWVSKSRSKPKSKPKSKSNFLIIKIEFLIYKKITNNAGKKIAA